MRIEILTFELGDDEERARKVCEEATEMYAAYREYHDFNDLDNYDELCLEIGDVITAAVNFATAFGIDVQRCIDMVETKNIIRGRYD